MARLLKVNPPRVAAPDLPADFSELEPVDSLGRSAELSEVIITGLEGSVEAPYAELREAVLTDTTVDTMNLSGSILQDSILQDIRATEVKLNDSRIRRVQISNGRIGTLNLAEADIDSLELSGLRIDYLGLSGANIRDLRIIDSHLGSLDLPQATVVRAAFRDTAAGEVDSRELNATDLDLRGLDCDVYTSAVGLRGATMNQHQVQALAVQMAVQAGINVTER